MVATVDLAKLYLGVKQRSERDRGQPWAELAEEARVAARQMMDKQKQTIRCAQQFLKLERRWMEQRNKPLELIGLKFEAAIRSGNWICIYRTINNLNTGNDPNEGWIYILLSKDRAAQVKIGYTKNDLRRRLIEIRKRHEPLARLLFAQWVLFPSRVENQMHKILRDQRVSGNTTGESNEWFYKSGKSTKKLLVSFINDKGYIHPNQERICEDPDAIPRARAIRR